MPQYHQLSEQQINTLQINGCTASNWDKVRATDGFNAQRCRNVTFQGEVNLGAFNATITTAEGLSFETGVYNAVLNNCTIGDNALVSNIRRGISNAVIKSEAVVMNCNIVACTESTTFGQGTEVNVLNETGGRIVPFCSRLTAQVAYLMTFYRHDKALIEALNNAIHQEVESHRSTQLTIGSHAIVTDCGSIINTNIGSYANIHGALSLSNGTVESNQEASAEIGDGVIAKDFIILWGAQVTESALLERTLVGEASIVGKQCSTSDSLIFSNCQLFHGETCAIFAGPFTVSHHKSTLLIGGYYSFFNAGSSSNQSNHMYRLGARHQGITERGVKTTSSSYILWPARIGAFSLVKGSHLTHCDTSNLPFSFLIESHGNLTLHPGAALKSIGTLRDEHKWRQRDNRRSGMQQDIVNFDMLSPYTINKIVEALHILRQLQENRPADADSVELQGYKISLHNLNTGIQLYEDALKRYTAATLLNRHKNGKPADLQKQPLFFFPNNQWTDLAGMIVSREKVESLCDEIKSNRLSLSEIIGKIHQLNKQYSESAWSYLQALYHFGNLSDELTVSSIDDIINRHLEDLKHDLHKEFSSTMQTGYGIDDKSQAADDFAAVHGTEEDERFFNSYKADCERFAEEFKTMIQTQQKNEA